MCNIVQGFKMVNSAGLPCSTKLTKKERHMAGTKKVLDIAEVSAKAGYVAQAVSKKKEGACAI
jgi:hypothetical protein